MKKTTIERLENSRGRFVGVATKDGRSFNAKFISSSPKYVTIASYPSNQQVKLSKSNIKSVG